MKKSNLPDKSEKKNANLCRRMQDYKKKKANLWEERGQIHLKNGRFISLKKSWVQGKGNCILIRKQKQIDEKLSHLWENIW